MDGVADDLLVLAAKHLKGFERRKFLAQTCKQLCDGSPRKAEARFGWGRQTVAKGLRELKLNKPEPSSNTSKPRGPLPSEKKNPQLSIDIRWIVEPHTHSDPELKTSRQYIQKGKPLKKTKDTDEIFANVHAARARSFSSGWLSSPIGPAWRST